MADLDILPPVPYKSPVLNEQGFLTEPWSKWFRQIFARVGGTSGDSNTVISNSIVVLQASVAALQSRVNDLNQGPHL